MLGAWGFTFQHNHKPFLLPVNDLEIKEACSIHNYCFEEFFVNSVLRNLLWIIRWSTEKTLLCGI